jgi:guanylate kinase
MKRAINRDSITEEEFKKRDNAAPTLNEEDFNYIINNNNLEKTQEEVRLIYDQSIIHR